jgi:SAM-dependent methyltransferase
VHLFPVSQRTGNQVLGCRSCGLRALANRAEFAFEPDTRSDGKPYDYAGYVSVKREDAVSEAWDATLHRLADRLADRADRSLFDVGAGDGAFCALAREHGFEASGNEVSREAVELAKERYGIELEYGTLDELAIESRYDALTMWCVLAHVEDVDGLLQDCFRMLKPGGILFLQTPHWTLADRAALSTLNASRGRVTKIVDIRVARRHWQLHTRRSITRLLERHGFTGIEAKPQARYSLKSTFYLRSMGMPAGLAKVGGRLMDAAIKHGPVPRIVLDVTAQKPG